MHIFLLILYIAFSITYRRSILYKGGYLTHNGIRIWNRKYPYIIIPPVVLHNLSVERKPIFDRGLVFYVYTKNNCTDGSKYLEQAFRNIKFIKELDRNCKIALVTNCRISAEIGHYIDILYIIHHEDIPGFSNPVTGQFVTRMLYNSFPPFYLNYVLDTHVFPCDSKATSELFDRFMHSDVDISISSRTRGRRASGGAILFRSNNKTHRLFKEVYQLMMEMNITDDQRGLYKFFAKYSRNPFYKFQWLSSNWFYASHGIDENGLFIGKSRCYRSSIPVNGQIRFIHGKSRECEIMNGKNNSLANTQRVWFAPGTCKTNRTEIGVACSEEEIKQFTNPVHHPIINWKKYALASKDGLFWDSHVYD